MLRRRDLPKTTSYRRTCEPVQRKMRKDSLDQEIGPPTALRKIAGATDPGTCNFTRRMQSPTRRRFNMRNELLLAGIMFRPPELHEHSACLRRCRYALPSTSATSTSTLHETGDRRRTVAGLWRRTEDALCWSSRPKRPLNNPLRRNEPDNLPVAPPWLI